MVASEVISIMDSKEQKLDTTKMKVLPGTHVPSAVVDVTNSVSTSETTKPDADPDPAVITERIITLRALATRPMPRSVAKGRVFEAYESDARSYILWGWAVIEDSKPDQSETEQSETANNQ